MTIPTYLPYFVFAATAATVIAILYGLNRSLAEAKWQAADRTRTFRASAVILLGWLAMAIALSAMGAYHVTFADIPTIQYGILLPILVGALLIWGSETARRIIAAVPQQRLVGVQLYRALGVIFLILYVTGKLPGQLAWPAGVGDIAIGLSAPFVGLAYARSPRKADWSCRGVERLWHSRSDCRGRNRLYDGAVTVPLPRCSADERADHRPAHGADPGLPRAAVDRAASCLTRQVAPRGFRGSRQNCQRSGVSPPRLAEMEGTKESGHEHSTIGSFHLHRR